MFSLAQDLRSPTCAHLPVVYETIDALLFDTATLAGIFVPGLENTTLWCSIALRFGSDAGAVVFIVDETISATA